MAFMDKLVLVDTHANPDGQRYNLAPDISVYADDNVPDADAKTNLSKMELSVKLKFAETSDPFRDPKEFVSAIADAMAGKTSFADSDRRTNLSLPQHIDMPILTLMAFIVTSAR
jgi:hypothetical protein